MDKKIRVMVVDDQAVIRRGLSALLNGHTDIEIVGEAADGVEAVALARSLFPDVILMDINMPKMNGLEATKIISAEVPCAWIVGLSINDDPETTACMLDAGAAVHLAKGCDCSDLLAAIRKVGSMK